MNYGKDNTFHVYKQNKLFESNIVLDKKKHEFNKKIKLIGNMQ